MKRSAFFFALAGALALSAAALGRHRPPRPSPAPSAATAPTVPPAFTPWASAPPTVVSTGPGSLTLTAHLSDPLLPAGTASDEYLLADIVGARPANVSGHRAPVNLAVALDCSGSMQGEKLDNARRAAHALIDRLDERDRLAFVVFGTDASTLIPSTACSEDAKSSMHALIDQIQEMGSTNISGGLAAAAFQLRANAAHFPVNRVVLISDGLANVGITSKPGLVDLTREAKLSGISLTALGVGVDFDEDLMEQLAENGGGNYGFLQRGADLQAVFSRELDQLSAQVASNPQVTLHPAPGVQVVEVYGFASTTTPDGDTAIQLYDLPAGAHHRLMVHLRVDSAVTEGTTAPLAGLRLDYLDLLHDRVARELRVPLAAKVTTNPALAAEQRDRDVYRQVLVGSAASVSKTVATLYSSGQGAEAQRQMEAERSRLSAEAVSLGIANVKEQIERMLPAASLPSSASSQAGRVAAISMHRNIVDFAVISTAQGE